MSCFKRCSRSPELPRLPMLFVAALGACGATDSQSDRALLTAARPAWATPDHLAVEVDAAEPLTIQVHLRLRDADAAEAELYAVSDPDSPRYGQHLTAAEFRDRYAPTLDDVAAVQRWLVAAGLDVATVADNRLFIQARGTARQVAAAFGTRLGVYRVGERLVRAPMTALSVPAALQPIVATAIGLGDSRVAPRSVPPLGRSISAQFGARSAAAAAATLATAPDTDTPIPPAPGSRDGQPCSLWWDQVRDHTDPPYGGGYPDPSPYITCGYTPPRLRAAYGIDRAVREGNDGSGVTIAILAAFAASPTLFKDAQTYAQLNDPEHRLRADRFATLLVPGKDPSPAPAPQLVQSWWQDQATTIEAIHGMAPGANLVYVGARSNDDSDFLAALNYAIDHDLGSIISNPWSNGPESTALNQPAYEALAIQAGLRGIGLYVPAGDGGDDGPDSGQPGPLGPDFPAALPQVTAVGGTTLGIGRLNQRVFETSSETGLSVLQPADMGHPPSWAPAPPGDFFFGSGGGASATYPQPRYQKGVVPSALADQHGTPARFVPDVAITGHLATGFLIGQTQTFPDGVAYGQYTVGDTSLSCALMSGVMALAEQRHHHRIGFANPALYRAADGPAFNDIVPGPKRAISVVAYNNGLDDSDGVHHLTATLDYAGLTIHPAPGYDAVSGLGSPHGEQFLDAIPAR